MLSSLFTHLSSTSGIHVSLKAEKVFELGGIAVTNSMLYGLVVAVFMMIVMVTTSRKSRVKARKGFVAIIEMVVDFVVGMLEGVFGSREKAYKYAPIYATFFLFIMFNNVLGLLPVVGPGIEANGSPLFRPFTADLNGTIVMSVFAIITVQVLSIRAQGLKGHLTHYFTDKPMNPINFFIGILEVFGEFTRMLSLSLRLFLNTAVGEILIAVFTSLILSAGRTPIAVIPIILFELLVAGIQAYVFTVLTATYLGLAIAHAHDDEHHDAEAHKVEELPSDVNQKVTTSA
ncbi:MAG TPA: F0F1 ATP synthase subunit A [Candidatus Saccharibacteria bacterium]|jgi:F-type H+-transporting ATPase subunit a|nr:F0F1 ATP synthase subunit A [Candidatus Saccharibacteria bacterium]HMT55759.1 F0F1 ATP synthase subunit A [Candidatus Saccharibacteria bacterium]